MTKADIKAYLEDVILNTTTAGENEPLDQGQLTAITDEIAIGLETVNPNGPCYPSTPR